MFVADLPDPITRTFESRQEAEKWARRIESDVDAGKRVLFLASPEARSLTLREALGRYRDEKTIHKASAEQERYRIARWLEHPLAAKMLHQIVPGDLEKFRDERLASGKAFATVRHELNIISQVYEAARFSWRMRDLDNPMKHVKRPPAWAKPRNVRLKGTVRRCASGSARSRRRPMPGVDGVMLSLERQAQAIEEAHQRKFAKPGVAEVLARLAALSRIEYDRARDEAARSLGCRVGTLDIEVERARELTATASETPAVVQDDEPWPTEVDGGELLDTLRTAAQRFLILPHDEANVIALWALFTHCIDAVSVAPILALVSPEKRCGKTTTLDLLARLSRRALPASNITAAALFRSVEKWSPSLLIDEADSFLRERDELRVNSGHTRTSAFVVAPSPPFGDVRAAFPVTP